MRKNYILPGLVAMTLAMQTAIFYKEFYPRAADPRPESVKAAPKGTIVDLAGLPLQGEAETRLVLVEFSDYECPFCARHSTGVGLQLDKEFVKIGKMRHAFANNPLPMHQSAKLLATAALCAGEQGQYWRMHDVLFESKPKTKDEIKTLVTKLTIDARVFGKCIEGNDEIEKRLDAEAMKAKSLGLTGTPGFALGYADAKGLVHIEKLIVGAAPLEVFQKAINESLAKGPQS